MFKSGRWRSGKNKIKAVFKLQFQATQVFLTQKINVFRVGIDVMKLKAGTLAIEKLDN